MLQSNVSTEETHTIVQTESDGKSEQAKSSGGSMATAAAPRVYKNFIGGEWVDSKSGKTYENCNPANTDEIVGHFVASNDADVNAAVDAAKEAYKTWRLVPAPKRA